MGNNISYYLANTLTDIPNPNISQYLKQDLEDDEIIKTILFDIVSQTYSKIGSIFVIHNNEIECIEHNSINESPRLEIPRENIKPSFSKFTDKKIYTNVQKLNNFVCYPINTKSTTIGYICLANSTIKYCTNIDKFIKPFQGLLKIIIENRILSIIIPPRIQNPKSEVTKDCFLASVSHEIRTPLNGVVGYSQMLSHTQLDKTQKNYVENMNTCSFQLLQLINDILDISKLSSGKMILNPECSSISEITSSALGTLEQRINKKEQTCNILHDSNIPKVFILDKAKLIQILVNLISNASKFSGKGNQINVYFSKKDNSNQISVKVEDNGIGIDKLYHQQIFQEFEQLDTSLTTESGAGLGLAISSKLCKLMGGTLHCESQLNVGSIFSFEIDYQEYFPAEDESLFGSKILVVGERSEYTSILTNIFREWKIEVTTSDSIISTFKLISQDKVKFEIVIFTDTKGENIELAHEIKKECPTCSLISDVETDNKIFDYNLTDNATLYSTLFQIISKKPIKEVFIGSENKSKEKLNRKSVNLQNSRIIIAEDIKYNSDLLVEMLHSLGCQNIYTASDGLEAWKEMKKAYETSNPYDILLLDLIMPKMNGYEVIQKHSNEGWQLPIIVVITASATEQEKNECKQAGVDYFITKPILFSEIKKVLHHVFLQLNKEI